MVGLNYVPEPTGIAPYTTRMVTGLADRGHDVRVITAYPHYPNWSLPDEAPWRATELIDGVTTTRVRHYVPSDPGSSVKRVASELSFGVRAASQRWGAPNVVLCPSPGLLSSAVAEMRVAMGRRPAVGIIVQDLYSAGVEQAAGRAGAAARALARVERSVLRQADGVSVIHERFRDRLVQSLGVGHDRISVIRNWTHLKPIPEFDTAAFRASIGWAPDDTVVLHAGGIGAKQGLSSVVEAAKIAESRGLPIKFVLMGDGGKRAELQAIAGACTSIEFRDPLPDREFAQALRAADILLVNELPGVVDMAVPSKLTSYFSVGRPVLAATDSRSITAAEVSAAGAGVVVPPGQPALLIEAATALASDPRAAEIGLRGRAYCETHLSEESALDAYDVWVRRLNEIHVARTK